MSAEGRTVCSVMLLLTTGSGVISMSHQTSPQDLLTDADLSGHVARIVHAVQAEGYDIATFYGPSILSERKVGLTRRDVEDHASHPSTESRIFELRLTSGEPLRMSLQKRSAMRPDVRVVERVSGREEIRRPQIRDCFFSGSLQGEEGHASLSLCDGQVLGAIHARKRDFEVHVISETASARRHRETEPLQVLVTWTSSKKIGVNDGMVSNRPCKTRKFLDEPGKQLAEGNNATIEVGVYLDRFFLNKVEERLGLSTTQQLVDLVALKWSGIYADLSNPPVAGWKIAVKVAHLAIWRDLPSWYNETNNNISLRLDMFCNYTKDEPFDQLLLETENTPCGIEGIGFLDKMCQPIYRCSAAKGASYSHMIELHETGHNLGLPHDEDMSECNPNKPLGFMMAGGNEILFRECYATVLNRTLRTKDCLFKKNVDTSQYKSQNNTVPLYRGQEFGFDDQCKLTKGEKFQYFHIPTAGLCSTIACINKESPVGELVVTKIFMGTPCGDQQMCYEGACVHWVSTLNPDHLRPLVVNSTWGPWSEFTSCDNTCGEAVSVSTRSCINPRPYCAGDIARAKMCPSRPDCPGESRVDSELVSQRARAVCTKVKNSGAYSINLTGDGSATSLFGEVDKCTVTCNLVVGVPTSHFLLPDGTPCSGLDSNRGNNSAVKGISWRCVRGRCMAFGCNRTTVGEGGGVELDRCGVCGGDGSSCVED